MELNTFRPALKIAREAHPLCRRPRVQRSVARQNPSLSQARGPRRALRVAGWRPARSAAERTGTALERRLPYALSMTFQQQISFSTTGHGHMHDLTEQVATIAADSGIRTGFIHVFTIGSTAAVGTIEFEPGLERDLPEVLDKLLPPSRHYGHEQAWHDGNGHSHLQATLLGPSLTVPLADGKPILGTWQQIFHLECDVRARKRTVVVTVYGD